MTWKSLKPSLRAVWLRSFTSPFRCGCHLPSDRLARLPDGPPLGRILRLGQHAADLVVGHLLAVHHRAEDVERLFDEVRLGEDLLQQLRIELLGQVVAIEDFDLAPQQRIGRRMLVDGLQPGERRRIGQAQVQLRLNASFLRKFSSVPLMLAVQLPRPASISSGRTTRLVPLDEAACPGVAARGSSASAAAAGGIADGRDGQGKHQTM